MGDSSVHTVPQHDVRARFEDGSHGIAGACDSCGRAGAPAGEPEPSGEKSSLIKTRSSKGCSRSTRRRAYRRQQARRHKRGSYFWKWFLGVMAFRPAVHASSYMTSSWCSSSDAGLSGASMSGDVGMASEIEATASSIMQPCPALVMSLCSVVVNSYSTFGVYAKAFVDGRFPITRQRIRDVLPLPLLEFKDFATCGVNCKVGSVMIVNLVCAGLNYLFTGGEICAVPKSVTKIHYGIIRRLVDKLQNAYMEMGQVEHLPAIAGSFADLSCPVSCSAIGLQSDCVDYIDPAAQVDPMLLMDVRARDLLSEPDLFPDGVANIVASPDNHEEHVGDLVSLTLKYLRAGKVSLMHCAAASADVFPVLKSCGTKQREVWNGSRLTAAAAKTQKPPMQATPAALTTLEASVDRPLRASCRDGKVFFDQLRLPASLIPYFGRPRVSRLHLLFPPTCSSGAKAEVGLTESELEALVIDAPCSNQDLWYTPVCNSWPMGFGWSSYVAQATMLSSVRAAGFDDHCLLTEERVIPATHREAVAIATDDVNHFIQQSNAELADTVQAPLKSLDMVWESMGIVGRSDKAVDSVLDLKVLGVMLRDGTRLQARGSRVVSVLAAVCDLANKRYASPLAMAALVGHIQWQDLMSRPLYACLHAVYDFMRLRPENMSRRVPDSVISEILLNSTLFAYWSTDLTRPWWPFVVATDASPAYGFGMSMLRCCPDEIRNLAAATANIPHVVRLWRCEGDPAELPRLGTEVRLPWSMDDFRTIFSIKAQTVSHSGAMELAAVKLALLRITRKAPNHGHRGAMLVDAQAVGLALRKGRTSSFTLKPGVCSVAAISLACDLKLSFPYLPSESNAADFPSRGKVKIRAEKSPFKRSHMSKLDQVMRRYRHVDRRLRSSRHWSWD